jgi:uncharacterized protein YciI
MSDRSESVSERGDSAGRAPVPVEMKTYYLGTLLTGPRSGIADEEDPELQRKHLDFLRQNTIAGQIKVAGPLTDGGTRRGLLVIDVGSKAEAEALMAQDPAVIAGRFVFEVNTLYWPSLDSLRVGY